MNDITKLDLTGLSCPEPAFQTKQLLKNIENGNIEITVDSGTARDNVERVASSKGWNISIEDLPDGGYRLSLSK